MQRWSAEHRRPTSLFTSRRSFPKEMAYLTTEIIISERVDVQCAARPGNRPGMPRDWHASFVCNAHPFSKQRSTISTFRCVIRMYMCSCACTCAHVCVTNIRETNTSERICGSFQTLHRNGNGKNNFPKSFSLSQFSREEPRSR